MKNARTNYEHHLQQVENLRRELEEKSNNKLSKTLGNSMSMPQFFGDRSISKTSMQHSISNLPTEEDMIVNDELKKLKYHNFQQNLQREKKKIEWKKVAVLEKEFKYNEKLRMLKTEKEMLDRCKFEAQNQAMKNKEDKLNAIQKLKGLSVLDKKLNAKTK